MFDHVPVRVWLLIAIAAASFGPARYVFRSIAHSPNRRDITQPPDDLSWRTPGLIARNSAVLAALIAAAAFIFTPAATQFARSPSFWPLLMIGLGAWALFSVANGLATGRIRPFVRGSYQTYVREAQPKRFWASLAWNAAFGSLFLWLAFEMNGRGAEDRCYGGSKADSPQEELAACNEVIGKRGNTSDDLADLVAARGYAYDKLGDYPHAMIDYTRAIHLDPRNSDSYFNRALIYERLGDRQHALTDFSAVIRLHADDADAYVYRGLIFLDTGKFDEAVADFSRAHEIRPKDPWALADRGITYAHRNDRTRAEEDFKSVRAIDPSNPVLLRGEALLSFNAGDMKAAVSSLTAALKRDPGNRWSLRMRAEAYRQLGEDEKADADADELWRLSKNRDSERSARQ